jgi:hypothetical protein
MFRHMPEPSPSSGLPVRWLALPLLAGAMCAPVFIWAFGLPWGAYLAIDLAVGGAILVFASWLVLTEGRKMGAGARRWGFWLGGGAGVVLTALLATAEAGITAGYSWAVLAVLVLFGSMAVPIGAGAGLALGWVCWWFRERFLEPKQIRRWS